MQPEYPLNILFIDDDPDDGEALEQQIGRCNPEINFMQVHDGWEAIMYLQKLSTEEIPSLIILDINMRIINGFEFLKIVKEENLYNKIPVVVYTTSNRIEDRNLCIELGAIDFYTKPDNVADVKRLAEIFVALSLVDSA